MTDINEPVAGTPVGLTKESLLFTRAEDRLGISKKCRRVLDVTNPETKAVREQGDKDCSCPNGKSYVKFFREQE